MEQHENLPIKLFKDFDSWIAWLEKHHEKESGIWVKFAKKSSGVQSITYEEAREGAIMYGWIDGLKHGLDETYYTLRITKRRPKGNWSKINREIAEELIKNGRMQSAGMREVDAAKNDGRWEKVYDSQSKITIPEDFQKLLNKNPKAKEFFSTLNSANRYAFLYRIQTAKKPETRKARIEKFIEMLNHGEAFH